MIRTICCAGVRLVSFRLMVRAINTNAISVQALNLPLSRCIHNHGSLNTTLDKVLPKPEKGEVNTLLTNIETQCQLNGYANYDILKKLLIQLEDSYSQLSAEQMQFLLTATGTLLPALNTKERVTVIEQLWQKLQSHNTPTFEHYHTYLRVLSYNRAAVPNVEEFLHAFVAKHGKEAKSSDLLSLLLTVACASGDMRQAAIILAEIRSSNYPLTNDNFASLLMGNALNGDYTGITNVQESMIAAGLSLNSETQMMLVCGHLEHGETAKAMEILTRYPQFNGEQVIQMLRAAVIHAISVNLDVVMQLVKYLPAEYTSGTDIIPALQNICIELIYQHNITTLKTILQSLPAVLYKGNQDVDTFGGALLHEMFRAQVDVEKIVDVAQMLVDSGKNTRAMHIIAETALRRNAPLALPIFKALLAMQEELRPHYFWPLFLYNFRRHGESGILRTLKIMIDFNIECDEDTLRQHVLPRLSIILDDPQQSIKQLSTVGLNPTKILTPVIKHLLTQQKIFDILKLVEMYPTKLDLTELAKPMTLLALNVRSTKRYYQYAKLFKFLTAKSNTPKQDFIGRVLVDALAMHDRLRKDANGVSRLVQELSKLNLSISHGAAELIENTIKAEAWDPNIANKTVQLTHKMRDRQLMFSGSSNDTGGTDVGTFIKHPRDMSLDELECHLLELESKHLNTRGVLRRLLQLCVREGRLQRALDIKEKCDELKVLVSPGMLASTLDMYIKLKDLPKAQATLKKLQTDFPGFQIDEHKFIDFCVLLIQNKELESAKQHLKTRASSQRIQGGDYVLKNVWNLLSSVAELAAEMPKEQLPLDQSMTREMFALLQRLGYCKHQNAVLGPIVRERLLRGQIELAVDEFTQLAEQYKSTPLQYELLSLLISYSNDSIDKSNCNKTISVDNAQQLLSKVCDTIKKVHGVQNLNSALLLAFAESGTDGQLRRLFINPEFRINQELLMKNCENLDQKGAVKTLLRLARNSRGVGHIIDEQSIYNMILQNCVERNDFVAALDLYERLNEDDELKISQDFLRQLVKLLHVNKIEVPSSIALRIQVNTADYA